MGKYVVISEPFCYLVSNKSDIVYPIKLAPIREKIEAFMSNQKFPFEPWKSIFDRYIWNTWPWYPDFKDHEDVAKKFSSQESELFNFIVENFPKEERITFNKRELSPEALIHFLKCYCWINPNYEAEAFVLSNDIDFAVYRSRKRLFGGRERGERVVMFRYSEFKELDVGLDHHHAFGLIYRDSLMRGRLDKKWNNIDLNF